MAMLNESNLLAMKARAAKFRTHHVGTKLNEAEAPTVAVGAEVKKRKASRRVGAVRRLAEARPQGLSIAAGAELRRYT